ncbi:G2/mitotic-specific cyclin-B1-like isoform X2 [Triplophysa rosa]|uniref:G2/mitotic-specific cyclin-B1-like isoform X2 n=1 Tax=Triplophysa rosa TaxID=992332 RepID=UPI002545DDB1|nr:G2/mitotic-specific cyclin-B1-like isoform X2 [Triplophysa rosa]
MSPRITRANSRNALLDDKATAVPYCLRSRVPLGNASNVIGHSKAADKLPKKEKTARLKKERTKAKGKAPLPEKNENISMVCETVKPVTHTAETVDVSQGAKRQGADPQTFSRLLLDIQDVDSADAVDAGMCSEYVLDIYSYLQQLEARVWERRNRHNHFYVTMAIRPCYLEGQEITGAMRAVAIDWLMQVQGEFKLRQETMFMTVNLIDSFLQKTAVPKKYFQLVCVTAMLIASKYEEIYPPTVGDFAFVTDGTYTCEDMRRMEKIILKTLNYSLGKPVAPHFLQRACKVGQAGPREQEFATFLMELAVLDYDLVHVAPSLIAAAAFAASLRILGSGEWSSILQHYTGYKEETLAPVMQGIVRMLEKVTEESKWQEMKSRYAKVSTSVCGVGAKCVSSENVAKLLC